MKNEKLEGLKQIWRIVIVNLQFKKSLSVLFFIITFGSYFAACEMEPANIPVDSMRLNPGTLTLTLGVNETAAIVAVILPENATNKTVTWSSSNRNIVTVESGVVTAVATGTATITAFHVEGDDTNRRSFYAYCYITVNPTPPVVVPVTEVTLEQTELNLTVGDDATLVATVLPEDATNKNITWTTSNRNIASVSDGLVTAVAAGTATITVTTVDGNKTASCLVTVNPAPVPVTDVTISETSLNFVINAYTTLTATVQPNNATNKAVTWSSSNTSVATVENGLITAIATGTATISVATEDGNKTADCNVTVLSSPTFSIVTDSIVADSHFYGITFGNNTFIAYASGGKMFRSSDGGITWIDIVDSTFGNSVIRAIAYGDDVFLAVGNGGKIARSIDNGITWTAVADSTFGTTIINQIAYGNNVFIAVGDDSKMARSIDNGVTWTAITDNLFSNVGIFDIVYGNNTFIASIDVAGTAYGTMIRSTDYGITWTAVTDSPHGYYWNGIAYGNNVFVATDGYRNIVRSTDNGVTWMPVTAFPSNVYINGIGYGGNVFIVAGDNRKILFSTDNGVTWNSFIVARSIIGLIAYGNNTFIARGSSRGLVRLSFD